MPTGGRRSDGLDATSSKRRAGGAQRNPPFRDGRKSGGFRFAPYNAAERTAGVPPACRPEAGGPIWDARNKEQAMQSGNMTDEAPAVAVRRRAEAI